MSDLLAIVGPADSDEQLLQELARRRPDRVTVLAETTDADPEPPRPGSRLARLLRAIEQRSGGVIVGLARDRNQLRGWRFDRVVGGGNAALAA